MRFILIFIILLILSTNYTYAITPDSSEEWELNNNYIIHKIIVYESFNDNDGFGRAQRLITEPFDEYKKHLISIYVNNNEIFPLTDDILLRNLACLSTKDSCKISDLTEGYGFRNKNPISLWIFYKVESRINKLQMTEIYNYADYKCYREYGFLKNKREICFSLKDTLEGQVIVPAPNYKIIVKSLPNYKLIDYSPKANVQFLSSDGDYLIWDFNASTKYAIDLRYKKPILNLIKENLENNDFLTTILLIIALIGIFEELKLLNNYKKRIKEKLENLKKGNINFNGKRILVYIALFFISTLIFKNSLLNALLLSTIFYYSIFHILNFKL